MNQAKPVACQGEGGSNGPGPNLVSATHFQGRAISPRATCKDRPTDRSFAVLARSSFAVQQLQQAPVLFLRGRKPPVLVGVWRHTVFLEGGFRKSVLDLHLSLPITTNL